MLSSGVQRLTDDTIPDVREIMLTLWRHRVRIALVSGFSFLACVGLIVIQPKTYTATATIMIEDSNLNLNLQDFKDVTAGAQFDDLTVQTEVRMLRSPSLARQTIRNADLAYTAEYGELGDEESMTARFIKNLSIEPQGTSRVVEVSFNARDPDTAAQSANAHVDAYLAAQIEFKQQRVAKLGEWFEKKVADLKADVIEKSRAVEQFRADENLIIGRDSQDLVYQQISDIAAQMVPVEVHNYDMQARLHALDAVKNTSQPSAVADVVDSRLIQDLKAQASVAAQKVESLKAQYGPNHPRLIAAQSELSEVRHAIGAEVSSIVGALKNEQKAAAAQQAMLNGRLGDLNKDADTLRGKMITLKALQVEQEASQKLLDSFLANYQNIQSQTSFARPDAVVVSPAVASSSPAGLGKAVLFMIALMFSGSLALCTVFAVEMMQGGLRNFEDIRKLGHKPLGIVPRSGSPAAILNTKDSSFKECVKRIYMSGLMNNPARSILITSAMPGEGRTTFTVSMAYYLMSIGHSVIVVDADFLRPDIGNMTKAPSGPGLAEVLSRRITLAQAIDKDSNGLAILRRGAQALVTPDALGSVKFHKLLSELQERYAYVLIDSGPILARSESAVIGRQVDGIITVAEWAKTSRQDIASMFAMLSQFTAPVLGVVINRVDIDKYKSASSSADFLLPRMAA